ncbi:glycoside hydrolase domain-containing protein [Spirilliplanes yamanashiensis]|uniref:Rv2525c-like glycoside hydrolase-like domain-containing protein n=1 Tax=Spirilliplanes yamanashiensis TaxID=42233 RepID=A0A8J4DL43_9ACTN|nr:glycoside hydrolase domain-containing protein [Spirilliplanes yamanashiensis]MDP9818050.1 hypothetical protein [Spirilliplanes yamanashiensis]GIJ04859.1 hypothetical protein Sya03_42110 [Spirilliplanes yamanashiensis]
MRPSRRATAVTAVAAALTLVLAPAGPARAEPGTFQGYGFDACAAPSSATMQAWLASPYRAIGIYFGGSNRACPQPNLTAAWVAQQRAAGWHLMPIYLGKQASCTLSTKPDRIDDTRAAAQGRAAADDAVVQARAIGLPRESVLIYDMEAYRTDDAACRAGVLAYMSAWTARLHDHAYFSGFYSSMASGMADQVAAYHRAGYVRPDYIDFARWDNVATVDDPAIPATYWSPHRRMKQYRGGHVETWGGVSINIDNDYLDVAPLPAAGLADATGNGWSDVYFRQSSTGALHLSPGNGTVLDSAANREISRGWNTMNAILRLGDVDRDGRADVLARQPATGNLFLYRGQAGGTLAPRTLFGTGWNGVRELTAIGDATGDGYPDLLAVRGADLWLYAGTAAGPLAPRVRVGAGGWSAMSELAGVGDLTGDGRPDMVARVTADGRLFLYPGAAGGGFGPRRQIGTAWNTMRDLAGVGDFDRDGRPDLVAVQVSSGNAYLYRGTAAAGFAARTLLAGGFAGRTPVL